jgi:hypothetical protein
MARNSGNAPLSGHCERLRERFLNGGSDALADYEPLELVLFRAIPRKDVKPLAKDLIKAFGSFAEVVAAPTERRKQVGLREAPIAEITLKPMPTRVTAEWMAWRDRSGSRKKLGNYPSMSLRDMKNAVKLESPTITRHPDARRGMRPRPLAHLLRPSDHRPLVLRPPAVLPLVPFPWFAG